jgi:phosphosulfolactate synthase
MVMDKGLSIRQAHDLIEVAAPLIDFVKLGFGTSLITGNVKEKVKLYKSAGIQVYAGGTLFEAFWIRKSLHLYKEFIHELGLETLEISDGTVTMKHSEKCRYISEYSKEFRVLSEVGRKDESDKLSDEVWVTEMQHELLAGSYLVIAESRESGTVGIYDSHGKPQNDLINLITREVDIKRIMWEAPQKSQQAWLIKQFGSNVNLGNIAPDDVVSLETLRLGLRGDTFFDVLPDELK